MANQLLNDFMEGNFQNIGELIDILNMSNPDLHLDKQNFEKFLSDLRTGMESLIFYFIFFKKNINTNTFKTNNSINYIKV